MLISLNWIRDFVPIPPDLDPRQLAERFTVTCAEVEGVEHIEPNARGIIAARVKSIASIPENTGLRHVVLEIGGGKTVETVTSATTLRSGDVLLFAPPGAGVGASGKVGETQIAGRTSVGMIVSAHSVGIALGGAEAVVLPPSTPLGEALPPDLFDDWVIEVDNKAITHRPDLWGHYGIAREIAAMLGLPLKPYPVVEAAEIMGANLPPIPIEIDDPKMCPRYTGLVMRGLTPQPSPLWMQLRLGHVGMRPIDALVDLTNYVMAELGQPMHAFDGGKVDRIEVETAKPGTRFTTLDGVERKLPDGALMIQSHRRPVALAGVMGGRESEVSPETSSILLESANFEPATIRRCTAALGLRTEASARFEKSLDPANTLLGIQRFVTLAREQFPNFALASGLSDCYPSPRPPVTVRIEPQAVGKFMGHPVDAAEITGILTALEFRVEEDGPSLCVHVPSFRATKDISIAEDIIEEVARFVGYGTITPTLPEITARYFTPNPMHALERATLRHYCETAGFCEIHGYIWYDRSWNARLGYAPKGCVELRNPAAEGLECLRQSLLPGLLASAERNRHHFAEFKLVEVDSVFSSSHEAQERRHLGLMSARRQKKGDDDLLAELKGAMERWSLETLGFPAGFDGAASSQPWDHSIRTSSVIVGGRPIGRLSVVPLELKRAIDEHLAAWALAWAEIDLSAAVELKPVVEKLPSIPEYPQVELDFSFLVPAERHYRDVAAGLAKFEHPQVKRITYVGFYEGQGVEADKRSLTFRVLLGEAHRTLTESDLSAFRTAFEDYLSTNGYVLRK